MYIDFVNIENKIIYPLTNEQTEFIISKPKIPRFETLDINQISFSSSFDHLHTKNRVINSTYKLSRIKEGYTGLLGLASTNENLAEIFSSIMQIMTPRRISCLVSVLSHTGERVLMDISKKLNNDLYILHEFPSTMEFVKMTL